ncbi:MAG: hypothetical protein EBU53_05010 [Proteobacteria bacterium]|nr:hypothetical protein [Pseudomonadota bacterium]
MMGKPEPETDEETDALEQECINEFGIDFCGLAEIAERLLPLCEHAHVALSGAPARGFASGNRFICKVYDEEVERG